jgi:DNA-binding response OmpR family regulator
LVLLDEGSLRDDARAALKGAGFEVVTLPPTEAGVDELVRRKVKCVMLNLGGGAAAWHTLRVLRERVGSRALPILAYVMTKDAPAGFCLGRADLSLWPMDPGRLIERLGRLRPKLKRLLALSADVDGMGRLREPLARARISTSIVLDGKQALEFAAMVDPEAAILHFSPTCPSATRALVGLRTTEATRDLPVMLLIDKNAAAREDAFFTAATVQLLSKPAFQFTNLPEEIARVIG